MNLKQKKEMVEKGFGITSDDKKRTMEVDYTIDTNKRGKDGTTDKKPRLTE